MKGLLLSGGLGTRLHPVTLAISKQLLPIYDKPMIYYPLSVLMLAGIRDIALITTPHDQALFQKLLGDGSQWGMQIQYIVQLTPEGIAQSLLLAQHFIQDDHVCLILGDNLFYGHGLPDVLQHARSKVEQDGGGHLFAYHVADPQRYGVVDMDASGRVCSIVEKPRHPKSHYAVTGLYFYDRNVCQWAKQVKPSARGELEITDLNAIYLKNQQLQVSLLGRGYTWLDAGTHDAMLDAVSFVATTEKRQGLKIGCPEEIAFRNQWIDADQLAYLARPMLTSGYGRYLMALLEDDLVHEVC